MTVYCPHVTIHPDTRAALDAHAPGWVGHTLDPADMGAYTSWLADRWAAGADVTVVEQDVVIHAGVTPGFEACPELWCVYPYLGSGRLVLAESLGCVRFRAGLLAALPRAAVAAGLLDDGDGIPAGDWRRLDVRLARVLRSNGHVPHAHEPMVGHRHHYTAEACGCGCESP